IEALSRGAADATFVDDDERAAAAIRRNVEAVGAGEEATVRRRDALAYLEAHEGPFDLVLIDPPYSSAPRMGERLSRLLPGVLSNEERISFITDEVENLENVQVKSFGNLLVQFARENAATAIIKGLRAISDFEYEFEMNQLNRTMDPEIESIYLMSSPNYSFL